MGTAGAGSWWHSWRMRGLAGIAAVAVVLGLPAAAVPAGAGLLGGSSSTSPYIVSDLNGVDASLATSVVNGVGGAVVEPLGIADAVLANLTPLEVSLLGAVPGVVVTPDVAVSVQGSPSTSHAPSDVFTQETGAATVWAGATPAPASTSPSSTPATGRRGRARPRRRPRRARHGRRRRGCRLGPAPATASRTALTVPFTRPSPVVGPPCCLAAHPGYNPRLDGLAWNSLGWNSLAWNGSPTSLAWNSLAWNGSDWNSLAWNSMAWNSLAWNGAAWNSLAWNGSSWNSLAWNSTAWNGAAWNSLAWNGSSWG